MSKLDEIKNKREIWNYNVAVLELWEHAKTHLPEDVYKEVVAFTFSDKLLEKEHREKNIKYMDSGQQPPYSGFKYHNAVRLNSGDIQEIPLIKRPSIPECVKVKRKEIN